MAILGMRAVTLLKDYPNANLKAGETVQADCWLNLDAYIDCAEVRAPDGHMVGLGRITHGGWKYADVQPEPEPVKDTNEILSEALERIKARRK
jgi:hypothetical protein